VSGKDTTRPGLEPTTPDGPVPNPEFLPDGQHASHWVLSAEERAKGYMRPVRETYLHAVCGATTRMPLACAETYARMPGFYGSTFCCACRGYFRVGEEGEFTWLDDKTKVGT